VSAVEDMIGEMYVTESTKTPGHRRIEFSSPIPTWRTTRPCMSWFLSVRASHAITVGMRGNNGTNLSQRSGPYIGSR